MADQPGDVDGLVPEASNIRVLYAPGVVGAKRNVGSDAAAGEFIAVWDDDDSSGPGRLTDQVGCLLESGKSVTGYYSMKFTDGTSWWQYTGWPNMALGTSLVYRKSWWRVHPFRELQCGQDEAFSTEAHRAGQLVSVPDRNLMYGTNHPGNTSDRSVPGLPNWKELSGFKWKGTGASCPV